METQQFYRLEQDRKACSELRRIVFHHGLDHMLSLTTDDILSAPRELWAVWDRFLRRVGRFPYVAVIAPQLDRWEKTGVLAWHLHAALHEPQNGAELCARWKLGRAECKPWIDEEGQTSLPGLSNYLQKNLREGSPHLPRGLHRYRKSRGLAIPHEDHQVADEVEFEALLDGFRREGREVQYDRELSGGWGRCVILGEPAGGVLLG